jgi:hypothetical protein
LARDAKWGQTSSSVSFICIYCSIFYLNNFRIVLPAALPETRRPTRLGIFLELPLEMAWNLKLLELFVVFSVFSWGYGLVL